MWTMNRRKLIENPYRPGAGHTPPFLAGRSKEEDHFRRLLRQNFATENTLITGLRGMGKTVLLAHLKQLAEREGWICIGNDLSESSSLSEERLALRILTDISESLGRVLSTSSKSEDDGAIASFEALRNMYERSPGLPSDRLRNVLLRLGSLVNSAKARGIVLAYDEAQCLSDHADHNEFPMSMLIETIASLQRKDGVSQYLLVLCGLPQVHDALTEARTYTERMFNVISLERLSREDAYAAFVTPLQHLMPPLCVSKELIDKAVDLTRGYPYLIQFFGKELVDELLQNGGVLSANRFPSPSVLDRLDSGLFAARWNKTTDKQREVLNIIACRPSGSAIDVSAQEIAEQSLGEMTNAQATQMLQALTERGLLYRTRHGRYAFTVPMSEMMILRRIRNAERVEDSWLAAPPFRSNGTNRHVTVGNPTDEFATATKRWRWFRS
jgi:DNA-binding MarR family transcriptional regulator